MNVQIFVKLTMRVVSPPTLFSFPKKNREQPKITLGTDLLTFLLKYYNSKLASTIFHFS